MTELEKQIAQTIKEINKFSDEDLIHYYKCICSMNDKKQKALYSDLFKAIEKERKSRGSVKVVETEDLDKVSEKEIEALEKQIEKETRLSEQKDNDTQEKL